MIKVFELDKYEKVALGGYCYNYGGSGVEENEWSCNNRTKIAVWDQWQNSNGECTGTPLAEPTTPNNTCVDVPTGSTLTIISQCNMP